MSALTFTAASVLLSGGAAQTLIAGGTIARGNVVRKSGTNTVVAASNNTAPNAIAYGIALNDAAAGQPVEVAALVSGGTIAGVASNCEAGKVLLLGTNGAIIPVDDIAGTEFVSVVGVGYSASVFTLGLIVGGVGAASGVS